MSKLIARFVLFCVPLVAVMTLSFWFIVRENYQPKSTIDFEEVEILALGDSHIRNGIDPAVFSACVNVAALSEPLYFTYYKLKELIAKAPNLDAVILGYAPHNIAAFQDSKLEDASWIDANLGKYWFLLKGYNAPFDYPEDYEVVTTVKDVIFWRSTNMADGYIGNYKAKNCAFEEDKLESVVDRHFPTDLISERSIIYLDSIVELLAKRQVQLILVNTPVHQDYRSRIPPKVVTAYNRQITLHESRKDVAYFDYSGLFNDDSYFRNYDHVCSLGSDSLSLIIKHKLEQSWTQ